MYQCLIDLTIFWLVKKFEELCYFKNLSVFTLSFDYLQNVFYHYAKYVHLQFFTSTFFSTTKLDVTHWPLKDLQNLMFSRYLLIINLLFYVIKQKKTASTNFSRVYSTWSQNKIRHINFYYFTPILSAILFISFFFIKASDGSYFF